MENLNGTTTVYDTETYIVEGGVPYYVTYPNLISSGYRTKDNLYSGVYTIENDSSYQVTYTHEDVAYPL